MMTRLQLSATTSVIFSLLSASLVSVLSVLSVSGAASACGQQEVANAESVVFSGPQIGEKLLPFSVRGVFDDDAGKELDFVSRADGRPIVLIFVHDVNRQSISMTRVLSGYTAKRAEEGLHTGVVWLDEDMTAAEATLKRIRHGLAPNVPTGISVDGQEGPGSYGLNRKVMLTILIGKDNVVTGNFALIQPGLQADLPRILKSISEVAGGPIPKLSDLEGIPQMAAARPEAEKPPEMRSLLVPVIRRDATAEEVVAAAEIVEQKANADPAIRKELGRIAVTVVNSGKLSGYGTPRAQEFLRKWADVYGKPGDSKAEAPTEASRKKEVPADADPKKDVPE